AGFEQGLHLRLLVRSSVDVPVSIDEARHRAHALRVDGLETLRIGPGGDRNDLAGAHNHGARVDHRAVAHNHAGVGDRDILCRQIPSKEPDNREAQKARRDPMDNLPAHWSILQNWDRTGSVQNVQKKVNRSIESWSLPGKFTGSGSLADFTMAGLGLTRIAG